MIPIHELLNRIRWDEDYGSADFVIGYYDRIADKIIRIPFRELYFNKQDHFNFTFVDEDGEVQTVPLHRIRQVFRNGELVWQRQVE
ncbi:MAG: DUF504 domain-containing protein [Thioalkalispiraceae bacterium]|jgi:uncharacterized protein (UPF0248 family)